MSIPATWKRAAWGGWIDAFGVPHAATEATPYTGRCLEKCSRCKERTCSKANGHSWSCNCHYEACSEKHRANGSVYFAGEAAK